MLEVLALLEDKRICQDAYLYIHGDDNEAMDFLNFGYGTSRCRNPKGIDKSMIRMLEMQFLYTFHDISHLLMGMYKFLVLNVQ